MRALLSKAAGGPETLVLTDLPDPVAGPGRQGTHSKVFPCRFPKLEATPDWVSARMFTAN